MPETYELPKLPYALNALEPSISSQIMDLHYNRHHQTYITNLNASLTAHADALSTSNLPKQLDLQPAIKFNAGGHITHTLFWESLAPPSPTTNDPSTAAPELHTAITHRWRGDFAAFKSAFEAGALAIQGSGWMWLLKDAATSGLELATSKDQDLPVGTAGGGKMIVFGVDMWEHAYYLQYFNNKKEYLAKIWDVVNWKTAERRFKAKGAEGVFGSLAGLASSSGRL
ncbi:MAG: hypothetical protein Q9227_003204 [Pyrenula ochraceoflavens]